jgi:uncharacterized protein YbjT (DUF2867 family)
MIVIVGATGNIGSKTAEILLSQGESVRAIARDKDNLQNLKTCGAEIAVGDSSDTQFLTNAFTGATAVLLIIPSKIDAEDLKAYQDEIGEAQFEAIKKSGVKNIIFVSSQGGHIVDNESVIAGLARQEVRLNSLPEEFNVLSLRPAFFMENLFNSIETIRTMNIICSSLKPEVKQSMIATQDIAKVAAERLSMLNFEGKTHQDLLGDRDYSMNEIAKIIGTTIGKPELLFVELSYEYELKEMMFFGISKSSGYAFVKLNEGINSRKLYNSERNSETTTATTFEEFAKKEFKNVYQ